MACSKHYINRPPLLQGSETLHIADPIVLHRKWDRHNVTSQQKKFKNMTIDNAMHASCFWVFISFCYFCVFIVTKLVQTVGYILHDYNEHQTPNTKHCIAKFLRKIPKPGDKVRAMRRCTSSRISSFQFLRRESRWKLHSLCNKQILFEREISLCTTCLPVSRNYIDVVWYCNIILCHASIFYFVQLFITAFFYHCTITISRMPAFQRLPVYWHWSRAWQFRDVTRRHTMAACLSRLCC